METLYSISAVSVGGRNGHVKSDGVIDFETHTPGAPGDSSSATNPEELFAAAYAACFNGALGLSVRLNHLKPTGEPTVKATVSLGKTTDGDFGLAAKIEANVPGVTTEQAKALVEQAHAICPYSRATRGNIEVELIATNH